MESKKVGVLNIHQRKEEFSNTKHRVCRSPNRVCGVALPYSGHSHTKGCISSSNMWKERYMILQLSASVVVVVEVRASHNRGCHAMRSDRTRLPPFGHSRHTQQTTRSRIQTNIIVQNPFDKYSACMVAGTNQYHTQTRRSARNKPLFCLMPSIFVPLPRASPRYLRLRIPCDREFPCKCYRTRRQISTCTFRSNICYSTISVRRVH